MIDNNIKKLSNDEKVIYDKIARERADEFRSKYMFKDINSLEILKEFYILKFPNDLGISGSYIRKKGRDKDYNCIYINTNEPIGRQNFSLMHELYHAFYEKSNEIVSLYKMVAYDSIEFTAERFASYVLIPREILKFELTKIKGSNCIFNICIEQLFDLQEKFKCSFISLVYAISELKNERNDLVPRNINQFWKYKNQNKWDELKRLTDHYIRIRNYKVNYNEADESQFWPNNFKENIENNIDKGLISKEEVEELNEFFEEE